MREAVEDGSRCSVDAGHSSVLLLGLFGVVGLRRRRFFGQIAEPQSVFGLVRREQDGQVDSRVGNTRNGLACAFGDEILLLHVASYTGTSVSLPPGSTPPCL
ncbi:MYXO-CTERM sorting domain-containing protein [Mesorhizobium sp.]|uniref:MYXO-CTERM sorting domain-containing protein n=1 Tax=Mesorhizobium sp. TaxID=1871066 RepID=UPI00345D1484